LYGNVPSDVINVYQPPRTDFYITFKSPRMRGRFTRGGEAAGGCSAPAVEEAEQGSRGVPEEEEERGVRGVCLQFSKILGILL
jgi:hypothetical protein